MRYMFGGQASVPLVVRTNSGAPGSKAAQHSQSLEAWFLHVPGLKVVTPATPADAKGLLTAAIRDPDPVIFLEHKRLYFTKGEVPAGEHVLPIGQAAVVREGRPPDRRGEPDDGAERPRGGRRARHRGDRARGDRRADDQPARHGHDQRERAQDRAPDRRARGEPDRRLGRRGRSPASPTRTSTTSTRRSSGSLRRTPRSRSPRCSRTRSCRRPRSWSRRPGGWSAADAAPRRPHREVVGRCSATVRVMDHD